MPRFQFLTQLRQDLKRSRPSRRSRKFPLQDRLELLESRKLLSAAAINYGNPPSVVENVFMVKNNNLYVDRYDPSHGWQWVNLGRPGGVQFMSAPAAINYSAGALTFENVFLTGSDGNLYADEFNPLGGWQWVNLGRPAGVQFINDPAAINYSNGGPTVENVFLTGSDGNLYADHYDPSLGWQWVNQGHPGGVQLTAGDPAAINYSNGGPTVENVFTFGGDGNLYADHYDPLLGWQWVNQGHPGGVQQFIKGPAAINYSNGGPTVEDVYVSGSDGNLYVDYYDPSHGWQWVNQGRPAGVQFIGAPNAINYSNGGPTVQDVYVSGSDGNLYVDYYDPSHGWQWVNLGRPAGVQFINDPAAINYSNGGPTVENVFTFGNDGNLYADQYDPSHGWHWVKLGSPV
jgi:hypothetical protein